MLCHHVGIIVAHRTHPTCSAIVVHCNTYFPRGNIFPTRHGAPGLQVSGPDGTRDARGGRRVHEALGWLDAAQEIRVYTGRAEDMHALKEAYAGDTHRYVQHATKTVDVACGRGARSINGVRA